MTNNNHYWQPFPSNIVDNSNLLVNSQPQIQTQTQPQQQQHSQSPWNGEVDKRKWNPEFGDFNANKIFGMDEYNNNNNNNNNNNEPSEADSPDSGGGPTRRNTNESTTDLNSVSSGDQRQRRKEQNRAAQRAFRERKEKYVKELQQKIKEMEAKHHNEMKRISNENESLKQLVKQMEAEIYTLKGAAMAFNVSISKLREAGLDIQHTNPSPPQSERQSPPKLDDKHLRKDTYSPMATLRDKDGFSVNERRAFVFDEDASFAERESNRFDHRIHPLMNSGVKMIPCSQIWERLSQHPNFDEFNLDKLCEELKKKAVCSGHGPVIPESELLAVLHQMDHHPTSL